MSEQGLLIETKTASLETMAVTIQALHVNGKQMTLAVFRQLPDESIYSGGESWGWVRYTTASRSETWLIRSIGGALVRCRLTGLEPFDAPGTIKDLRSSGVPRRDMASLLREAREDHMEEFREHRALIADLPQLFIAV